MKKALIILGLILAVTTTGLCANQSIIVVVPQDVYDRIMNAMVERFRWTPESEMSKDQLVAEVAAAYLKSLTADTEAARVYKDAKEKAAKELGIKAPPKPR